MYKIYIYERTLAYFMLNNGLFRRILAPGLYTDQLFSSWSPGLYADQQLKLVNTYKLISLLNQPKQNNIRLDRAINMETAMAILTDCNRNFLIFS